MDATDVSNMNGQKLILWLPMQTNTYISGKIDKKLALREGACKVNIKHKYDTNGNPTINE